MKKIISSIVIIGIFFIPTIVLAKCWGNPFGCCTCSCAKEEYLHGIEVISNNIPYLQRKLKQAERACAKMRANPGLVISGYFCDGPNNSVEQCAWRLKKEYEALGNMQKGLNWANRGCPGLTK
jgi:hypothetical protein